MRASRGWLENEKLTREFGDDFPIYTNGTTMPFTL